jgi:hypothetical protein
MQYEGVITLILRARQVSHFLKTVILGAVEEEQKTWSYLLRKAA